jgi:hypothetical protein
MVSVTKKAAMTGVLLLGYSTPIKGTFELHAIQPRTYATAQSSTSDTDELVRLYAGKAASDVISNYNLPGGQKDISQHIKIEVKVNQDFTVDLNQNPKTGVTHYYDPASGQVTAAKYVVSVKGSLTDQGKVIPVDTVFLVRDRFEMRHPYFDFKSDTQTTDDDLKSNILPNIAKSLPKIWTSDTKDKTMYIGLEFNQMVSVKKDQNGSFILKYCAISKGCMEEGSGIPSITQVYEMNNNQLVLSNKTPAQQSN